MAINPTYNGVFDIAIGKHRKDLSWRNKSMFWAEFVNKISQTHYTSETHAEYMAAKKSRQDEIKDVGGFIGGFVAGGRRKAGSILHRQLITLDIDYCSQTFWDDFSMLYGNAAVVYSTHKHSPESPRLRLVVPLDRAVQPDEYEAIARHIAGVLNIELFDPTTFQPERLMYWPSTSKGAEYVFNFQDGPWISADEVLASYTDWKDSSQWPVSVRVDKLMRRSMLKQGDPLEKHGVIGAFCRTYTIQEAIDTYLSDVYEACDVDNRYTYLEGSTAGGLVIYDDKYAYSHHGTDPTSGKLCNAFDLVRIHKFGLKDEDAKESTPGNKLPSYLAMVGMSTRDAKVRKLIIAEKTAEAISEFSDITVGEGGEIEGFESDEWKEKLDVDRKGNIYATIDNISMIFDNDPYFRARIAFDDFEKCEVAIKDLPWRRVSWLNRRLIDRDDANIRHYLEKAYGISNTAKTKDAMQVWAQRTLFHPIKDYLSALTWDGEERVETLFIDYQGAADNRYVRAVTRKTLCAAVARIFQPGIKFDTILTLVGNQGMKKSTIVAKLGQQWFSDSFSFHSLSKNETKALEQIQGVWIVEVPEMSGMAKAEVEAVKHFVSKTEDRFRVAYGHRTESFPRQCVFIGSTNKFDFLKDPTGNRRFWPVLIQEQEPTKDVFEDLTQAEIDQIWAEAVYIYKQKEVLYLTDELLADAVAIQKRHTEEHPWLAIIQNYLDIKLPENWSKLGKYDRAIWLADQDELKSEGVRFRSRVCVQEIWYEALGRRDLIDERSNTIIRNIMANTESWKMQEGPAWYGEYGTQRHGFIRKNSPYIDV